MHPMLGGSFCLLIMTRKINIRICRVTGREFTWPKACIQPQAPGLEGSWKINVIMGLLWVYFPLDSQLFFGSLPPHAKEFLQELGSP